MPSLQIIYATGSGHTQYVIETLVSHLEEKSAGLDITTVRAEQAQPEDVHKGDVLILACGTWNTGGVEGQLQPFMNELLRDRAKDVDLAGKKCALIALGDERYYYTARANEHLRRYILDHGGEEVCDALLVINEPYGQEEKVCTWGEQLITSLQL